MNWPDFKEIAKMVPDFMNHISSDEMKKETEAWSLSLFFVLIQLCRKDFHTVNGPNAKTPSV